MLSLLNYDRHGPWRARALLTTLGVLVFCLLAPWYSRAGTTGKAATAQAIEAAFLYRFLFYVDWPEPALGGPDDTIKVCVLGEDPFGELLTPIESKTVDGRPLALRRFRRLQEARDCHLLFIGRSELDRLDEVFADLEGRPVLTVSDGERFVERGGMIGFVVKRGRVRFEINREAADRAGLRLSSHLLRVAR